MQMNGATMSSTKRHFENRRNDNKNSHAIHSFACPPFKCFHFQTSEIAFFPLFFYFVSAFRLCRCCCSSFALFSSFLLCRRVNWKKKKNKKKKSLEFSKPFFIEMIFFSVRQKYFVIVFMLDSMSSKCETNKSKSNENHRHTHRIRIEIENQYRFPPSFTSTPFARKRSANKRERID